MALNYTYKSIFCLSDFSNHLFCSTNVVVHCNRVFQRWTATAWTPKGTSQCYSTGDHSFRTLPFLSFRNDAVTRHCLHLTFHSYLAQHSHGPRRRLRLGCHVCTDGITPVAYPGQPHESHPQSAITACLHNCLPSLPCHRCRHCRLRALLHHPQFFGRPHHDLTRSLGCSENVLSCVCGVVFPPSLLPADPNLSCLISHHDFVTRYPRLPLVGAFVQIRGYLSRTLPSDAFAVDIVDINYFFPFGLLPPQPHSAPTLPLDTPCDETVVSRASPNCSL